MRKIVYLLLILGFVVNTSFVLPDSEEFEHDNNGFVILPHAINGEIKSFHNRVSILGACDPRFPLFINGEEVAVTANGYFNLHVPLDVGENLFVFGNGEELAELIVIREVPEPFVRPPRVYYEEEVFGFAPYDNISRFYDGDDDGKMGTPLARGTTFRIIAEDGGFYILHDGSYVFRSNVELLDELDESNLYSIEMLEAEAVITFYRLDGERETETVPLEEAVTGYFVEFIDGEMQIRFNRAPTALSEAVVIIDAGHGGIDSGAVGPPGKYGAMEKDLNLYVSQRTVEYLEAHGITAVFIRDNDEEYLIRNRTDYISRLEELADLSVSVHANAMPPHLDFASQSGPLMFYTLDKSESAANEVLEYIAGETGFEFKPAMQRNFALARYTAAPSMLFEMGFIVNPEEYERLIDTDYLDLIAQSLGQAIVRYLLNTIPHDAPEIPTVGNDDPGVPQDDPGVPQDDPGVPEIPTDIDNMPQVIVITWADWTGEVVGVISFIFVAAYLSYGLIKQKTERREKFE
jgi:N-acetylmuramoyl-L-alanine amidase